MRSRSLRIVALVAAAAVIGFLLAVLVPRDDVEKPADTPTLIVTRSIPPAEP